MNPCERTPAPPLLSKYAEEIADDYARKREDNPAHSFQWPQREGQSLYGVVRDAAREMTQAHCAYCDAGLIAATGKEEIDHFRPKSRPDFYRLVSDWANLLYSCSACNGAKLEKWDELLLKPDAPDYAFGRFFQYKADSGEILPNEAATSAEQRRAQCTIEVFGLNRADACCSRKREVKRMAHLPQEEVSDASYRFLIPLC